MDAFSVQHQDRDWLVSQPETGMGYQLIRLADRRFALAIAALVATVFTTREQLFSNMQDADELLARLQEDREPMDEERDGGTASKPESSLRFGKVIGRQDPLAVNLLRSGPKRQVRSKTAELFHNFKNPIEPRMFFRFSANPADPRVLPNGNFAAETYATTFNDIRLVPSGLAAVGRYALPCPRSARYTYSIVTNSAYRMGTALPHHGQSGGGVEVFFDAGAINRAGRPHKIDIG